MRNKTAKILSSFALAAMLTCTGVAAQAVEVVDTEYADTLSIESCSANIKGIYKENYPEQSEMIDDIVDTLSSSDEFISIFEDEGATAFQIIEDSLRDALVPTVAPTAWDDDEVVYYTKYRFPSIRQKETNFCGVASMLMALMGSGKEEYITNSSLTDKMQYDYAEEVGIYSAEKGNTGKGLHIQTMKDFLQKRFTPNSLNYEYRVKGFTKYTVQHLEDILATALSCDTVPIISVNEPWRLSYYPDNYGLGTHYIVIESIDLATGNVDVVDPHYSDEYFGRHTIKIDEVKDLVYSKQGLWICVYTKAPDGDYVYD